MTKDIRPLIPVNITQEEQSKLVEELLNESVPIDNTVQIGTNPPQDPENYIILETIDAKDNKIGLYVAKTRDFFGKNWYEVHEALAKESYQMLTIRQGIDLIKLLKSRKVYDGLKAKLNDAEVQQILNEIIEIKDPWRSEWLDARFIKNNNELYLLQENGYDSSKSGKLEDKIVAKSTIKINPLMQDTKFNINDTDKYGLPTKEGTELNYWYPRENHVARFYANSSRAGLDCYGDPDNSDSELGVRRAKILK